MKKVLSYINLRLVLNFFLIMMLLVSCKNAPKSKDKKASNINNKELNVKQEITDNISQLILSLPSSFEVTEMLNNNGISYMIGATNELDFVSRYFTSKSKAFNIGVYGSDLSYVSTYRMTQETMLYLKVINQLGNDLGISSIYNENLLNRIQDNLNNKDTLVEVLTSTLFDTYDFLNKNGKGDLSVLMATGGYVEGLYLVTNSSSIAGGNPALNKIIFKQENTLEKLLEILESKKDNADFSELIEDLKPVKNIYDEVQNETMTAAQVHNMALAIEKIRNKLIS